ncbi:multidrug effflux MFS transporter [Mammaliicoccus stepanovicii]|uniref:Bcr/CflA family efflux transporter n=1 Tax=Mammaliicoccus stepanovicii TaxID=643214 RepID=A0A239YIP3_9STAP|nr:multidrug effflux MFS transporter [Mammaliicoccus stepanovicii]PNZ73419.1 Bcr/CflA family drug resistance efflux transporter [Mammaliicoccus stepanovicii]GGI40977.1 Bcr/CflA family drug resistance efflux transporter [Mammaliicoccus stepanovicii]SNV58999.1 major facilitator superfamily permease [Mammaliicoccus stepanovicii]
MTEQKMAKPSLFLIIILGLLTAFGPLSIDMYLPALPQISQDYSTTTSNTQLTLTLFMIGLAIGQVFIGPLSDFVGRKKPLIIVLAIYAIASILCVFAPNIYVVMALRFVQGFTGGAGAVISRAISSDLYQGKALTKFLAVLMLVNGLAPILAPVMGGAILAFSTWKTVFIILTIFGMVMFGLSLFKLSESLPENRRSSGRISEILSDFKLLLKSPKFLLPLFIQGCTYALLFSYISASPFITQSIYHISPQMFSWMFAFNGLGLILSGQLINKLVDKYDEHTLMRVFGMIQILGVIIVSITLLNLWPIWLLMIGFFILVSPVAAIGTTGFSIAMSHNKGGIGSASSLLGLSQFAFGGLVSPLVGIKGEHDVLPYIITIVVVSLILIILFLINKRVFRT